MSTAMEQDVIDVLRQQHGEIRDLFDLVRTCAPGERREAFERLVRLLAVHETAEEEIVHPAARRTLPGGDGIVADRLEEERSAKELLSELDGMDTGDPQFMPKFDKLRTDVLTHARAEERYEFEKLQAEFSEAERRSLAAAVRAAEAMAPTRPHPGTESATKNMLAGPPMAMMDQVRDMIRNAKKG
ncbi:hemerythrin domain-containing protein [Spirillospora sp. NPDC048911]|uniref:hemerythrin domain-containing protein n=1 Tax=Spirillospora sp. NPDC048911 TaxID=3364527 RepID=UPI003723CD02